MKFRIFTLFVGLSAAAWSAGVCQSGTLANLTSQGECTIGVLTFNFQSAQLINGLAGSSPSSQSGVGFAPVVAPGMQGFTLTGPFSASGSEGTADTNYGRITYFVSGSTNLEVISLLGETRLDGHPDTDCQLGTGYCYIDAGALAGTGLLFGNSTFTAVSLRGGAGQVLQNTNINQGWLTLGFGSSDLWVSHAGIDLQVNPGGSNHDGSATTYLSSATFWFREASSPAPEPGTWLLMCSACVPLLWRRARRPAK